MPVLSPPLGVSLESTKPEVESGNELPHSKKDEANGGPNDAAPAFRGADAIAIFLVFMKRRGNLQPVVDLPHAVQPADQRLCDLLQVEARYPPAQR